MLVSDFNFTLPDDRIATHPVEPRDAAKLLQVSKFFFDFTFTQLPDLLKAGDVMVFNDSKVIPARLFGTSGSKEFEVLLHQAVIARQSRSNPTDPATGSPRAKDGARDDDSVIWTAFIRPLKKLKISDVLIFSDDLRAELIEKKPSGEAVLCFTVTPCSSSLRTQGSLSKLAQTDQEIPACGASAFAGMTPQQNTFFDILHRIGHMPLPPYIKREDEAADAHDYQTIYAKHEGSVAAPTAGLHFTPQLMQRLQAKGIHTAFVTLHVGAGTFQPVKVDDTNDHVMHSEYAIITPETADAINRAKEAGGKVIAVGTTSLRILETATDDAGTLHPFSGSTDIFITPGYHFKLIDRLVTNFHLPCSTLFMLVCAFSGADRMKAAYAYAIANRYRFYSYGDGCLLDRKKG